MLVISYRGTIFSSIRLKLNHMTSGTKIILGLMAAAVAGAAIGILIAPEKGSELRKRIKNKAGEWVDDVSELLALGKEKIKEVYAQAEEDAENLQESIRETVSKAKTVQQ